MNIRLDYINKFEEGTYEKLEDLRRVYINLDLALQTILPLKNIDPALERAIALARTHLEESLMYGIKSLCLKYEVKDA